MENGSVTLSCVRYGFSPEFKPDVFGFCEVVGSCHKLFLMLTVGFCF